MCLFTTTVYAQINKQQSESIVVEQIYENQLDEFDIYTMTQTRTSSDNIHTYDNDIMAIPYSTCYVFLLTRSRLRIGIMIVNIYLWMRRMGIIQ